MLSIDDRDYPIKQTLFMDESDKRIQILTNYNANSDEIDELLMYNDNQFQTANWDENSSLPLPDELHISVWQEYVTEAKQIGAYEALQKRLVQLNFSIAKGISTTASYRALTRRGEFTEAVKQTESLKLQEPAKLELRLHQTIAGKIPVIIASNREDFVALVRALTKKNEPQPIADSMGACIVAGYNNWDRINRYRSKWSDRKLLLPSESDWQLEFKKLILRKELYQDRFIILSRGNYSNVAADDLELAVDQWQKLSLKIRLEHECTHYLTRRLLGSMRNNLLDEVIADYRGIVAANGSYLADWFLHFLGLEAADYRPGGRLENYRGTPTLSDGAFKVLQKMIKRVARNLEDFDQQYYLDRSRTDLDELAILFALTTSTIEHLAASDTVDFLLTKTTEAKTRLCSIITSVGDISLSPTTS